jgi:hypothetical protein
MTALGRPLHEAAPQECRIEAEDRANASEREGTVFILVPEPRLRLTEKNPPSGGLGKCKSLIGVDRFRKDGKHECLFRLHRNPSPIAREKLLRRQDVGLEGK